MSPAVSTAHPSSIAIEAIAYHGWGFDRSCWQPWKCIFEQIGCDFETFDRGYFGQSAQPEFRHTISKNILMGCIFVLFLN